MKVGLRPLLPFFLLLAASPAAGQQDWSDVASKVSQSLYRLELPVKSEDGADTSYDCTGVSINQQQGFLLTDLHCLGTQERPPKADGVVAVTRFTDLATDLAVLQVGVKKPALKPADPPRMGQPFLAIGYGWGLDSGPLIRAGWISTPASDIPNALGAWVVLDNAVIPGMSGGPVVDRQGRILSIVDRGDNNDTTGFGHAMAQILALTKAFWP